MTVLEQIQQLALNNEIRISDHGYDELANDGLSAREVTAYRPDSERWDKEWMKRKIR